MSSQIRKAIMFWFTLFLGIALLSIQSYRYYTNTIELNLQEFAVTMIAVVFMVNPNTISDTYKAIVKSKLNGKDDR